MKIIAATLLTLTLFTASSCKENNVQKVSETDLEAQTELKTEKNINVLFVLTSHHKLGDTDKKTGFWLEEFASPYYTLKDKGAHITIATPKGGAAPIDPRSDSEDAATEATKRFDKDDEAKKRIANTKVLATMNPDDFDAVFYPGGHGPLWDLSSDKSSIALIEKFNSQNKPIAFVCHAPAALKNVKDADGNPLVKGKQVTGFTNSEEEAVGLKDEVPFLIEDMLKEIGGIYSKKENWAEYVLEDENLITGQNPASSKLVAETLYAQLNK